MGRFPEPSPLQCLRVQLPILSLVNRISQQVLLSYHIMTKLKSTTSLSLPIKSQLSLTKAPLPYLVLLVPPLLILLASLPVIPIVLPAKARHVLHPLENGCLMKVVMELEQCPET